jgi:DNA mismatch repair protein MutS2
VKSGFTPGDLVQTTLGKGVVREARNNGRLVVEIGNRSVVLEARTVAPLGAPKRRALKGTALKTTASPPAVMADPRGRRPATAVDLHGLTVDEALVRAVDALNAALLAGHPELRLIHGRSGGRVRASLHRRLREIPTVRAFRLDPANPGVTIVSL